MNRRTDRAIDMGIGAGLMYLFGSRRRRKRRGGIGGWAADRWSAATGTVGNAGRIVQLRVVSLLPASRRRRSRLSILGRAQKTLARQSFMGAVLPATTLAANALTQAGAATGRAREAVAAAALTGADQATELLDRVRGVVGITGDGATAGDGVVQTRVSLPKVDITAWVPKAGSRMPGPGIALAGACVGATTAYLLSQGDVRETVQSTVRRIGDRVRGMTHEAEQYIGSEPVSDQVLAERVREALGHAVSHPGSIDVSAEGGRVTLAGPVLAREVDRLLARVRAVPGVTGLENRLQVHERADGVPGLQGRGLRSLDGQSEQDNWGTTVRVLVAGAGGMLAASGIQSRGVLGVAGALVGLGLLARGVTNYPVRRLLGGSSMPEPGEMPDTAAAAMGSGAQ